MGQPDPPNPDDFAREADRPDRGWLADLAGFLADNRRWWLAPIVIVLLLIGGLLLVGGTAAAPFIYTLF